MTQAHDVSDAIETSDQQICVEPSALKRLIALITWREYNACNDRWRQCIKRNFSLHNNQ